MKLIKTMICAVTVGTLVFAADKAQAVASDLFTPLNVKLSVRYYDANGNIKLARITSKEIMKQAGVPKNALLAIDYNSFDVVIVSNKTVLIDLTESGDVTLKASDTLDNQIDGKNGSYKYSEVGILEMDAYSDPRYSGDPLALDKGLSEAASSEWFEIKGFYSYKENGSAVNKKDNNRNVSVSFNAKALSGLGSDALMDLEPDPTVLTGSASGSGSGKLLAIE